MSIKLNSSGGGSVTLSEPATASDFSVSFRAASGNVVVTPVPAGNTTVAPLVFSSGTNLSTAAAGAIEYDGKVIYATPQGTQRGVVPGMQYFRLDANLVGLNATGAQNMFGVGVTLSSSTVYAFEGSTVFLRSAGTTSHTLAYLFGGTASINNIYYVVKQGDVNSGFNTRITAAQGITAINTTSATTVTGAMAAATQISIMDFKGTVSINAGGTFIPQYSLSAAPGGAYSVATGSYFAIWPIGTSGANVSVGTWA